MLSFRVVPRVVLTAMAVCLACVGTGPSGLGAAHAQQLAQPAHSAYPDAIPRARALLQERAAQLPGLSVAVGVGSEIVWAEGFGWADLEQRVPVSTTSRFRVGSVSKPLTAALLGLAVEEGALDLDAPVQQYVPEFPEKQAPITTRMLAGHLAGMRHYAGNEFLSSEFYPTVKDGLAIFAADPLLFDPGTQYSYSSYGWNLVSAAIESATGEEFLAQMQSRVFEPLGMLDTSADINALIVPGRVRPYVRSEAGLLYNAPYVDNSYKWAGGGFVSSASDLVRFGLAHLRPGFLRAETLQEWFRSQATTAGDETGYGIGWRAGTDDAGRRVISHGGGSVGGTTILALYPDLKIVVVMISNLSGAGSYPVAEVVDLFAAE